jgi:hypothetical protein
MGFQLTSNNSSMYYFGAICNKFCNMILNLLFKDFLGALGAHGSIVVKALCCKPEGRGFKS